MPNEIEPTPRQIKRGQHTLPPARWRLIVILTDCPGAGEAHLTKDELLEEFNKAMDFPDGLAVEIGTIEKAAAGSDGR